MREEVQDRHGNLIYLTDERWEHIIERHPVLDGHRTEILKVVRSGRRRRDPKELEIFYYKRQFLKLPVHIRQIEVVVVYHWQTGKPNNFIVTAYPA